MKFLSDPAQLAPVLRALSTRSTKPPSRIGYLKLLCKLDRLFLRSLSTFGASSWGELKDAVKLMGGPHFPTKETVDDWLTLAHRRGLIEKFEGDSNGERWALTAVGQAKSQSWTRRVWPVLRVVGAVLGSLATLVFGSAVLFGSLREVDWESVFSSAPFVITVIVLFYACLILPLFWLVPRVYEWQMAMGAIEMTRSCKELPELEIDAQTLAKYSAPPPADAVS